MTLPRQIEAQEQETAPARAYSALRFRIVEGLIPPETRVPIDVVARELGLSQTPVREALQRLEADGLLIYRPSRGYATTPVLDPDGLRALFEFRLLVEPWAARQAAVDALRNPSASLNDELVRFEQSTHEHHDVRQRMLSHDTAFHSAIIAASGNGVVSQAYVQTHCHLHVFRLAPVDVSGAETLAEHRAIWKAIADRDADGAERLMMAHIMASYRRSAHVFDGLADSGDRELARHDRRPMVEEASA